MNRPKDLRQHYSLFLQIGFIGSLSIFIVAFKVNFAQTEPEIAQVFEQEEVYMEEIVQTKQVETPPPPPRPPVPVEVPNDELIEDDIIDLDAELDFDSPLDLPPPPPAEVAEEKEQIFVIVEQQPELIGGLAGLQKKVKYPELAQRAGIEGRVIINFVVGKDGSVLNPEVVRSIGGGCDEEALRAVSAAKFKPGRQGGRPVLVSYTLPVIFNLNAK